MTTVAVGDHVRKVKGYYHEGTVLSVFYTLAGDTRVVVEFMEIPGLLHIYNPEQLDLV